MSVCHGTTTEPTAGSCRRSFSERERDETAQCGGHGMQKREMFTFCAFNGARSARKKTKFTS